jgi:hypothetical protein
MVPRIDDLGPDRQPVGAVADRGELELVDVEAPLVHSAQPVGEERGVADGELLLLRQLSPETVVRGAHVGAELLRVAEVAGAELRLEVHQLTGQVLLRDLEVV